MLQPWHHCHLFRSSRALVSRSLLSSKGVFWWGTEALNAAKRGDRGYVPAFDVKSFVADSGTGRARGVVAGWEFLMEENERGRDMCGHLCRTRSVIIVCSNWPFGWRGLCCERCPVILAGQRLQGSLPLLTVPVLLAFAKPLNGLPKWASEVLPGSACSFPITVALLLAPLTQWLVSWCPCLAPPSAH